MKKFVLTILAIAAAAGPAFAQPGDISAYADAAGTNCNISDTGPLVSVYLLHKNTGGATASQFRVVAPAQMTYLSQTEAPSMLRLGNANDDMSIAYTACLTGDFLICTVTYLGTGTTPACSQIWFEPAPTSAIPGELAMVDCVVPSGNLWVPGSGRANVNPNGSCNCSVAVQEKTWGGIKALYR